MTVTSAKGKARHGFIVQHATDPTDSATYSTPIPCTKPKFVLRGAPSKSVAHFKIAAIDPTSDTGMGPWSSWIAGSVR